MKKRYPQGGYHNCQVVVLLMGTILETKKLFALPISTGVLYKKINHLPCAIVDDITEALADIIIKKTSYPDCYEYRKK